MAGHKANDEIALDLGNRRKKPREGHIGIIGVDVLTKEGYLPNSAIYKRKAFRKNICAASASFPAPDVRNDTIGAEIITAVHNGNPGTMTLTPYRR